MTIVNSTLARAFSALTLTSALALTAGCAVMSPVQTDMPAQLGDGVNLNLGGGLDVRNLVVVGGASDGAAGRLTGQVVNNTAKDVELSFATKDGAKVSTSVPAHGSVNLADKDHTFDAVPGKAGDLAPVTITSEVGGTDILQVPILAPQGFYKDLAPTSS